MATIFDHAEREDAIRSALQGLRERYQDAGHPTDVIDELLFRDEEILRGEEAVAA